MTTTTLPITVIDHFVFDGHTVDVMSVRNVEGDVRFTTVVRPDRGWRNRAVLHATAEEAGGAAILRILNGDTLMDGATR